MLIRQQNEEKIKQTLNDFISLSNNENYYTFFVEKKFF